MQTIPATFRFLFLDNVLRKLALPNLGHYYF